MSSMGTGTKIGFILISILVVIVIANLLDNKVQDGPSGQEQVTGRSMSSNIGNTPAVSENRKAESKPAVTASGRETARAARPVRDQKPPITASGTRAEKTTTQPASTGQPARGTARMDRVQVQRTTGVLSNDADGQSTSQASSSANISRNVVRGNTAATVRPVAPKREFNKVVVEEGDSLWRLAERHLGSGIAYKKILEANKGLTEDTVLSAGLVLKIPTRVTSKSTVAAAPAVARNGRSYEIQDGDSLWRIASDQLGDGSRWKEIEKANPGENLQVLRIGKVIQLPRQ